MPLEKKDRDFRLAQVTHVDFKQLTMDRVLTSLFERIRWNGRASVLRGRRGITVEMIRDEFLDDKAGQGEYFEGFAEHVPVFERWIESHLLDLVNRGKANQAVAAPRPLHGYTYRFRDTKHARDYGAARQLYEMLHFAPGGRGQAALDGPKAFFFAGIDLNTDETDDAADIDVETQALLRLCSQVRQETAGPTDDARPEPVCVGQCHLLADDVLRLLMYRELIPRSVLVEYLKTLLAFHLALYHLRLLKTLPELVRRQGQDSTCAAGGCPADAHDPANSYRTCPYRVGLLVDLTGNRAGAMALLAQRSADIHYRRIPPFVKASFVLKKLEDLALHLQRLGQLNRPVRGYFTLGELLDLLGPSYEQARRDYFGQRRDRVLESEEKGAEPEPEIRAILDLKLDSFETYVEILLAFRGTYHRQFITRFLDSVLLKNEAGALLAQPGKPGSPRRFALESRLLETLLQLAVLRPAPGTAEGFRTEPMRIEDLIDFLRERYGLYVDRLPPGDGFGEPGIDDLQALRGNVAAFKNRLREIGFYRDLSDAYVTQTVVPRYHVGQAGV